MHRIIVTKLYPNNEWVVIGFFNSSGGESFQTMRLHGSLFPENIKIGDELIFGKKADIVQLRRA